MPSGAKKRKAAKKKKEKESNNSSTTHSLGDDPLKSHGEGGSEVSSPASQEHHNQEDHPFTEREEEEFEKREDAPRARSFAPERKSMEGVEEESIIQIDNNIKPVDHLETYVEPAKEFNDGSSYKEGGSSSYGSSSDDECQVVEKNVVVEENARVTSSVTVGEADNSFVQAASVVDDKSGFSKEEVCAIESTPVENSVPCVLAESEKNAAASSVSMGLEEPQKEDKLLLSFNAPRGDTSDDSDHAKDPEIPDLSVSQPLIASAPRTEQRTSWMSCCGILDVFKGNR